jgi:hypothetical protein
MSLTDNKHTHTPIHPNAHNTKQFVSARCACPFTIYNNNFNHAIDTKICQIPAMSMWIDMFSSFNSYKKEICSFIHVTFYWYLVKNIQLNWLGEKNVTLFSEKWTPFLKKLDPPLQCYIWTLCRCDAISILSRFAYMLLPGKLWIFIYDIVLRILVNSVTRKFFCQGQ